MFIDDSAGVLTAADKASIEAASGSMDVKVIVASTGSRAELDASVGRLVNSGNTLAIGVDPIHRYTFTHYGTGLGVPSSEMQAVARSGNQEFKAGRWGDGIRTIVASAQSNLHVAQRPVVAMIQQPTTVIEHPTSLWPFAVGGILAVVAFTLLVLWMRRRQRNAEETLNEFRDEAATLRARNVEEQGWHDRMAARQPVEIPREAPIPAGTPVINVTRRSRDEMWIGGQRREVIAPPVRTVVQPAPAPVIVNQQTGNSGDLLTGVLIGQAIADRREDTPAPSRSTSWDSGSSSSSWDSGSSSSWDSGSGGGGFDSGGGGGFDGGSGGGDF